MLLYTDWGLHVFLPSASGHEELSGKCASAAPKPNCALVSVADFLQRLSGGVSIRLSIASLSTRIARGRGTICSIFYVRRISSRRNGRGRMRTQQWWAVRLM